MKHHTKLFLLLYCAGATLFLLGCKESITEPELNPKNLLFVSTSDKTDVSAVDMWFSPPDSLGATSYTLQTSTDAVSWEDFLWYGTPLTTADSKESDNFSVNLGQSCHVRLRINGGTYNGQYSNSMWAVHASVSAYFSSNTLDESLSNSGTMAPNVGYGLVFSAVVTQYPSATPLENCLDYQWYRLPGDNFDQMQAISGATGTSYITTVQDIGHRIMVEASGKDALYDGMKRMLSQYVVQ